MKRASPLAARRGAGNHALHEHRFARGAEMALGTGRETRASPFAAGRNRKPRAPRASFALGAEVVMARLAFAEWLGSRQ